MLILYYIISRRGAPQPFVVEQGGAGRAERRVLCEALVRSRASTQSPSAKRCLLVKKYVVVKNGQMRAAVGQRLVSLLRYTFESIVSQQPSIT